MSEPSAFQSLGVSAPIANVLRRRGILTPTEIQLAAIPHAIAGRDLIALAQTGTGKTFGFGLPILTHNVPALILAPTRELALQIEDSLKPYMEAVGATSVVLVGGASIRPQIAQLRRRPQIVIATPGRLLDLLNQRALTLNAIKVLVLDEADRMLDMGFARDIEKIISQCPTDRQTMLFSATMPSEIADLSRRYLRNPERVEVAQAGKTADLVTQGMYLVAHENKMEMLRRLLQRTEGTILVFARTKHGARKLAKTIFHWGESVAEMHADRTMAQRKSALDGFKQGRFRVLVATDIASRGIDVKKIGLVVNYDIPQAPEDYVHRIGRTGRAGEIGEAITLATLDQIKEIHQIERLIRRSIPDHQEDGLSIARPPERGPSHVRPSSVASKRPVKHGRPPFAQGNGRAPRMSHRP